jgi:HAD superfamily phosphatase (TIGR01668 family)
MNIFLPQEYIEDIYHIDIYKLKQKGIQAVILDLDDTLISRHTFDITPHLANWIESLKLSGLRLCISSNGIRPRRVEYIAKTLDIPFITLAAKPLPFSFRRAMKILDAPPHRIAMIGDQIFTDILGGNLYDMYTILVDPISEETFWLRKIMRTLEAFFFNREYAKRYTRNTRTASDN